MTQGNFNLTSILNTGLSYALPSIIGAAGGPATSMIFGGTSGMGGCGTLGTLGSIFCNYGCGGIGTTGYAGGGDISSPSSNAIFGFAGAIGGLTALFFGGKAIVNQIKQNKADRAQLKSDVSSQQTTVKNLKSDIETLEADIKGVDDEIAKLETYQKDVVGNLNNLPSDFSKEVNAYKEAKTAFNAFGTGDSLATAGCTNEYNSKYKTQVDAISKYDSEIAAQQAIANDTTRSEAERKAASDKVKEAQGKKDAAIKERDNIEAEWRTKKSDAETALNEAKEAIEAAIQKKINEKTNELNEKKAQKAEKENKLEAEQKELEDMASKGKLSRKCDEKAEFDAIYKNMDNAGDKKLERAFNYAFTQYCNCNASEDSKKKGELRQKAIEVYNKMNEPSEDVKTKYNILVSGKSAFGLS